MNKFKLNRLKEKLDFISVNFFIYIFKCVLGASICYLFHYLFPEFRFYWSIVSVVLVISPDDIECKELPISRIKANIIGSLVGLILFLIHLPNLVFMCVGILLTIFICNMIKLGAATRSALAALVIVLIQESTDVSFISAFQRMLSVVIGCFTALIINYGVEFIINAHNRFKNTYLFNSEK